MSDFNFSAFSGATILENKWGQVRATAARLEAQALLAEIEAARSAREKLEARAPTIIQEIFTALRLHTCEGVEEARTLLGETMAHDDARTVHREVLGVALATAINAGRKRQRTGPEAYASLASFLYAATQGFDLARQLHTACQNQDPVEMLRAMNHTFGAGSDRESNRPKAACAAVVGLTMCQGNWSPSVWTVGHNKLDELIQEAESLLRFCEHHGVPVESKELAI